MASLQSIDEEKAGNPGHLSGLSADLIEFADFAIDISNQRLLHQGRPVALAPRYFAVLLHLARHANQLVTKEALLDAVWGHRHVSDSALRVAINAVRAALGEDGPAESPDGRPRRLHTVPRRGYRFEAQPSPSASAPAPVAAATASPAPTPAAVVAARPAGLNGLEPDAPADSIPRSVADGGTLAIARPLGNLPQPPGPLIGREAEVQRIRERLVNGAVLTLHGPGGVGKTHLALVAAAGPAPAHGTWLLRLESLPDAAPLVGMVARTLQLSTSAAANPAALARALATMQLRLVLDNAEHLIDAVADLVAAVHEAAPGVQILVTSQRPLQLRCEQLWPVAPLALPSRDPLADAAATQAAPAARLLVVRVRRLKPDFMPDAAGWADVAEICCALDGMPLALELAAARVPLLGLAGVRARLGERLSLLVQGPRDAAARHRTLRAALAWTWALLAPDDQVVLASLSVFPAGFTLAQASEVAAGGLRARDAGGRADGSSADALHVASMPTEGARATDQLSADGPTTSLQPTDLPPMDGLAVDDSLAASLEQLFAYALLQPADDGLSSAARAEGAGAAPRWRLLDSVRAFAKERLQASGRAEAVADRHLAATLAYFAAAERRRSATALRRWLAPLRPEIHNLRQAMQHALAAPARLDAAVALLACSAEFRLRTGWRREVLADWAVLKAAVGVQPVPGEDAARRLLFDRAATVIGALALPWPVDDELAAAERAEAALLAQGDRPRAAAVINHRLTILQRVNVDMATREALLQRMQALEAPGWSPYLRFSRRWQEGQRARATGDMAAYARGCAELLDDSLRLDDQHNAWIAAQGLSQAMVVAGDLEAADATMGRAIDSMREAGCLREYATALAQLATIRAERGAGPDTLALVRETVAMLQAEDMVWWMADAFAWLPAHQGRWADAVQVQAWADDLVRQRGGEKRGPMFAAIRARFQDWLQAQPDAAALAERQATAPAGGEVQALALALR